MADRVLKDIFVVPPISVLDVKQKYWKDRRKEWLSLNIQSELGRTDNLLKMSTLMRKKQKGTSVFDPVLCEIMYRWFTKPKDTILDPFAGGSVRGIVASKVDRKYVGIDLREEQVMHNKLQAKQICKSPLPKWISGDSNEVPLDFNYDFIFTCPPYYDLEKYSDDPLDLSNMNSDEFDLVYDQILSRSIKHLSNNRFAAIVVGDVRDKSGNYLKLHHKTVDIFERNGCHYYNDLILLQEPATAAMRSFNYMNSGRKIAKCHQNVLVFVKGDAKKATDRLPKFTEESVESVDTGGDTLPI